MSIHRRAAKRDANEPEIVDALERVGACVHRLSGEGVPDLLAGFRGTTFLLEVKAPDGTLTEAQRDFIGAWDGQPVAVVRSAEEALKFIGAIS